MRVVLISVSKARSRQCAADASPAVLDQTVLPTTRHRWTRLCLIYARKARPPHITRSLSRWLAPPPPAGIVWRRRQPKNRRRAAEPAEIIGRRRRHFYGAPRLVVISRQVNNDIIIAAVMTVLRNLGSHSHTHTALSIPGSHYNSEPLYIVNVSDLRCYAAMMFTVLVLLSIG